MERNLEWLFDKFIAHKGFHTDIIPQNSLAAFENAINNNYAIELDVRLLADNNIAVFHDSNLGKMTGQDGYISNLKTEDLQNYKLLKSNETIPTLKQVLELVNGRTPIFIDIKNESVQTGTFETQILENLKDYKGQVAVMSFNPLTLEWFKKQAPELARGLLSTKWDKSLPERPNSFFKRFVTSHNLLRKRADADFLAYNIDFLPSYQTHKFKNIPVIGWTVTSQEQYLEKVKYVDNIIFEGFKPKI